MVSHSGRTPPSVDPYPVPRLQKVLKTIRPPVFSDFVLEPGTPEVMLALDNRPRICGYWPEIDECLRDGWCETNCSNR
jgi:hypothetical protein